MEIFQKFSNALILCRGYQKTIFEARIAVQTLIMHIFKIKKKIKIFEFCFEKLFFFVEFSGCAVWVHILILRQPNLYHQKLQAIQSTIHTYIRFQKYKLTIQYSFEIYLNFSEKILKLSKKSPQKRKCKRCENTSKKAFFSKNE